MSIMVGVGRGARAGVLIKNAEALERMEHVDTLVVDKTGTLTQGKPAVVAVVPAGGRDENELLRLAGSVERGSEHPLGGAIVAAASARNLALSEIQDFDAPAGRGVVGTVEGRRIAAGNAKFLAELNVPTAALEPDAERLRRAGATAIFVACDGQAGGAIAVADPVKPTTPGALDALTAGGVRVVMLTGDNQTTAQAVARRLGIAQGGGGGLPGRKGGVGERLGRDGRGGAQAGDGVNDAPALAAADVGIAMGTGTDVAIESAGVTLVKGDLRGILSARKLSRAVMRNIKQNLLFAFLYN